MKRLNFRSFLLNTYYKKSLENKAILPMFCPIFRMLSSTDRHANQAQYVLL